MVKIVIVGKIFNCRECIKIDDEYLVDLSDAIDKNQLFCLNESEVDSGKKVFRPREEMLDRSKFVRSNQGDEELLFFIPFLNQVDLKNMTMIGGENGSSPLHVKLYANQTHPDFSLLENTTCSMEFETVENKDGEIAYELKPNKFKSITSLTLIVTRAIDSDFSKIYYISFVGTRTKVNFY